MPGLALEDQHFFTLQVQSTRALFRAAANCGVQSRDPHCCYCFSWGDGAEKQTLLVEVGFLS